jgi:hypothetical protein
MNQSIQVGTFKVSEKAIFRNASYECAAWWQDVEVEAGEYPVYVSFSDKHPEWFSVSLPGVVVEDNFIALWGGMPISKYDTKQNAGKAATHSLQNRCYNVFKSVAMGDSAWKIDLDILRQLGVNLAVCSNPECGTAITAYKAERLFCPSCSVARNKVVKAEVNRRHGWLLDAVHYVRPTEFAGILDDQIARYLDGGRKDSFERAEIVKNIVALRKLGPAGRKKLYGRYSPRWKNVA